MKQQDILNKIIPELRADTSVSAVMLMGSVAAGAEHATSDINLFLLSNKNKLQTELVDDIMVEYLYISQETAQSKLDKTGMEVYQYLGSKIIYDLDGRLIKLMRSAMNKYKNYKVNEKEKAELLHILYSTKTKLNAAIGCQEILKADFMTVAASLKIIEAVFMINEVPFPPASRMLQEVQNLMQVPDTDWFEKLLCKNTAKRVEEMLYIIDWALLLL